MNKNILKAGLATISFILVVFLSAASVYSADYSLRQKSLYFAPLVQNNTMDAHVLPGIVPERETIKRKATGSYIYLRGIKGESGDNEVGHNPQTLSAKLKTRILQTENLKFETQSRIVPISVLFSLVDRGGKRGHRFEGRGQSVPTIKKLNATYPANEYNDRIGIGFNYN